MTIALPRVLRELPAGQAEELICRASLGVWTERKRHMPMTPLHWEWCQLAQTGSREAVVAPREHAKSETFTINATVWESAKTAGLWSYIFCNVGDQAEEMGERIVQCAAETEPWLLEGAIVRRTRIRFSNGARVTLAGAGKKVRGAHPDRVVGDDVLEEQSCMTEWGRRKTASWWKGTVGGMAHAGVTRKVRARPGAPLQLVRMPPTRMFLVGTPFHEMDLLMGMRGNSVWSFRRYAAEFDPRDLVPGTMAVEVA